MFKKVQHSFFQKAIQRAGISAQVQASHAVFIANSIFQERFGEGFALHAKPVYVRHRTLAVEIGHPAVAEQLKKQEETLIHAINQCLGRPEIVRLQFILPKHRPEEM